MNVLDRWLSGDLSIGSDTSSGEPDADEEELRRAVRIMRDVNKRAASLCEERDRYAGEIEKARAAMAYGADDSTWRPGDTAVDALIRDRDGERVRSHALRAMLKNAEPLKAAEIARIVAACERQREEDRKHASALTDQIQRAEAESARAYAIGRAQGWRDARAQAFAWLPESDDPKAAAERLADELPTEVRGHLLDILTGW